MSVSGSPRLIQLLKNFGYAGTSNFLALCVSLISVAILPRLFSPSEFGLLQLYLLYAGFAGVLQFGWNDGIYLRYGGSGFGSLDRRVFTSQFWLLALSQFLIALLIVALATSMWTGSRQVVWLALGGSTLLLGLRAFPLFVLQMTNRIRAASVMVFMGTAVYLFWVVLVLAYGTPSIEYLLVADLGGKAASLLTGMFFCRNVLFGGFASARSALREAGQNCAAGISLMLANVASLLVIGATRFAVEWRWGVTAFGNVSLALSVSMFLMVFVSAISVVLFPLLKRLHRKRLGPLFVDAREVLVAMCASALLLCVPLTVVLEAWLPAGYSSALSYLALVFPVLLYEARTALLTVTFMKTVRMERSILLVNAVAVFAAILLSVISVGLVASIDLAVFSILLVAAFRSILGESLLASRLGESVWTSQVAEGALVAAFVLAMSRLGMVAAFMITLLGVSSYLAVRHSSLRRASEALRLAVV